MIINRIDTIMGWSSINVLKNHSVEKENKMVRTIGALEIKLQVASAKKRFGEQIERDPNMVGDVVSSAEYEEALGAAKEAKEEARLAREEKIATEKQFAALKTKVYEAERSKNDDKARIAELEKRLEDQEYSVRSVLDMLIDWLETDTKPKPAVDSEAAWTCGKHPIYLNSNLRNLV